MEVPDVLVYRPVINTFEFFEPRQQWAISSKMLSLSLEHFQYQFWFPTFFTFHTTGWEDAIYPRANAANMSCIFVEFLRFSWILQDLQPFPPQTRRDLQRSSIPICVLGSFLWRLQYNRARDVDFFTCNGFASTDGATMTLSSIHQQSIQLRT